MGSATARGTDFEVGQERELVVVEDLTRTQIVQYAGASGDFNPIHTDEKFATAMRRRFGAKARSTGSENRSVSSTVIRLLFTTRICLLSASRM